MDDKINPEEESNKITENVHKVARGESTGNTELDKAIKEGLDEGEKRVVESLEATKKLRKEHPFSVFDFEKKVREECLNIHNLFGVPKYLIIGLGLYERIQLEEAILYGRGIYARITGRVSKPFPDAKVGLTATGKIEVYGWVLPIIVIGNRENFNYEVTHDMPGILNSKNRNLIIDNSVTI